MKSILTKNQERTFIAKDPEGKRLEITVRFDDRCGNGHNDLSVTASGYDYCGCCHDEIKACTDLPPSIKAKIDRAIEFHLVSTDGPMHYVANALYHASTKDCSGREKGEPYNYETEYFFNKSPIPFKCSKELKKFIDVGEFDKIVIESYDHTNFETYGTHHTFKGLYKGGRKDWYGCEFSSLQEARQVKKALETCTITSETIPTSWGKGKDADLAAARSCALWPEAELKDFTKENLEARLPKILEELKEIVESFGFVY